MPAEGGTDARRARRSCSPGATGRRPAALRELPPADLVVAADSGLEHARALGLARRPRRRRLRLRRPGGARRARSRPAPRSSATRRRRTPPTSSSRCSTAALTAAPRTVTVVGGHGGRARPLLGERAHCSRRPRSPASRVDAWLGDARRCRRARRAPSCTAQPGDCARCSRRRTRARRDAPTGLRYPLDDETLEPGSTRGVSNELVEPTAHVSRRRRRAARDPARRPGRRGHEAPDRRPGLVITAALTALRRRRRRRGRRRRHDHARHPRLVRGLEVGARAFTEDRDRGEGPAVRRRRARRSNQAILTKDDPLGDVFFGVDNTFLTRALDAGIFEPYTAAALATVPAEFQLDPTHRAHADRPRRRVRQLRQAVVRGSTSVAVPTTLDDLAKPAYEGLLVVENPATSSPGPRVPARDVARFGDDGWRDYWTKLRATASRSSTAGRRRTTAPSAPARATATARSSSRTRRARRRPCTSRTRSPKTSPIGTMLDTCFRQVEFAGVLRGTEHGAAARQAGRLHAVQAVPGRHAAADVRVPGPRRTPLLPPCSTKFARGPPRTRSRCRQRDRPQPRALDRRVDRAPCCGERSSRAARLGHAARCSSRCVPRASSSCTRSSRSSGAASGRTATLDLVTAASTSSATPRCARSRGSRCGRQPSRPSSRCVVGLPGAYVLTRYRLPGRRGRARARGRAVRAADGRGRLGVPARSAGGPLAPRLDQTWRSARARLLQLRGRRAHRRRPVGPPRPAPGGAARMLGAEPSRAFRAVTLPALRPAIAAAAAIVFLFTFTSFGVILVLGGPTHATLETEIYRQTAQLLDLPPRPRRSRSCSSSPSSRCSSSTERLQGAAPRRASARPRRPRTGPRTLGERRVRRRQPAVMALLLGTPIAVLVARSFDTPTGFGLDYYRALGDLHARQRAVRPADSKRSGTRCAYAVVATVLAVVVGGLRRVRARPTAARRAALDAARHAPARRVGRHGRLRLPHRARRAAARPAHVVGARPDRAGAGRDPVRRPDR